MLRGRGTVLTAALAVVAVAAVTAGCGGGSSTKGALPLDPVAAAATRTQDAGAAHIRFAMKVAGQGKTVRIRGTGAMDGTSSEMTFKLGSLLGLAGLPGSAAAQLAHRPIEEITLEEDGDYVVYLRLGALLASQLPGGQQWIKLDVSKLGKSAGLDLGKMLSGSQLQPSDLLSMLRAEGAKVHRVGSARIDGAATTHYRVTVDVAKVLKAKGLASPLLSRSVAQMKTITENVWVGKDGLVRRVALRYGLPLHGSPTLAMTMDIYGYGAKIDIAAPPGSQVFDATQFAQQGLGSLH